MNELSIIIPVLSGFDHLPKFLDELVEYLKGNPGDMDIICVADETVQKPEIIMEYVKDLYPWLKIRVLQKYGKGSIGNYGTLVRFGMAYSTSKYVVLVSPHGEDDLSIISVMLNRIRKGSQLIQATRFTSKEDAHKVSFIYRIYQGFYRFFVRIMLGFDISDSTYAFKMFDRVFMQTLGISRNLYSICPEITLKSLLAGGKVEYVASTVKPVQGADDFKLSREGFGYVFVILRGFAHRIGIRWF